MNKLVLAAVLGMSVGMSQAGCASSTKRVVVEERFQAVEAPNDQNAEAALVARKTTTVQGRSGERRGLLSTAVHWTGAVLAFPFRLVGGLLRLLF